MLARGSWDAESLWYGLSSITACVEERKAEPSLLSVEVAPWISLWCQLEERMVHQ